MSRLAARLRQVGFERAVFSLAANGESRGWGDWFGDVRGALNLVSDRHRLNLTLRFPNSSFRASTTRLYALQGPCELMPEVDPFRF